MNARRNALSVLLAPLALAAAVTTACEPVESTADLVDRHIDLYGDQASVLCDCSDELGYDSRSECETAWGETLPAQRRCIHDAFARDEAAAKSYLDCQVPLLEERIACLDTKLECNEEDAGGIGSCTDDYDLGMERCIALPQSITRALEGC